MALLYFHQFPNYFLVSNLLVIPLAAIILYLGVLVFITSFFDPICYALVKVLDYVIWFLNQSVCFIETMPYSITERISINISETWAIYMLIVFSLAFITLVRLSYLRISLVFLIGLSLWQGWESYLQTKHKRFIVYNVNHEAAYDFVDARTNYFISQEDLFNDVDKMLFHVNHNWWSLGLQETTWLPYGIERADKGPLYIDKPFMSFHQLKMVVVDTSFQKRDLKDHVEVDYVILSHNPRLTLKELTDQFSYEQIIIDSSNDYWRANKWSEEAKELGINCYVVALQGAFVIDV